MFGKRMRTDDRVVATPPTDSDGKRRVFGEAVFAGKHGTMLRALGFGLNDPANVIPDAAEFDRRVKYSLEKQDARRTQIESDLLRRHGHNAIRPFFVLAEPVFNSELGQWLIRLMNLLPYDDWNIVYLPMDRATQSAMGGGLPLHPRQSIGPIDELMVQRIGELYKQFKDGKSQVDVHVRKVGLTAAQPAIEAFVTYADAMPERILSFVAELRPMLVALIADVQSKAA